MWLFWVNFKNKWTIDLIFWVSVPWTDATWIYLASRGTMTLSIVVTDWVGMAIILAGRDHNSFESTHSDDRIKLTSSGFRTGCTLQSQTPWLTNQTTALLGATKNTLLPVFDLSLLWRRPSSAPLLSDPPPSGSDWLSVLHLELSSASWAESFVYHYYWQIYTEKVQKSSGQNAVI